MKSFYDYLEESQAERSVTDYKTPFSKEERDELKKYFNWLSKNEDHLEYVITKNYLDAVKKSIEEEDFNKFLDLTKNKMKIWKGVIFGTPGKKWSAEGLIEETKIAKKNKYKP